jgi:hypothetical protein
LSAHWHNLFLSLLLTKNPEKGEILNELFEAFFLINGDDFCVHRNNSYPAEKRYNENIIPGFSNPDNERRRKNAETVQERNGRTAKHERQSKQHIRRKA